MEIGLLILGLAAGILSGLFGIGGGVIMVPTLIAIFGLEILDANATSLAAMLLPVGILGVVSYYKAGFINVKESLLISFGLFLGSFVGAEFAINVSEQLLSKLYAAFLLYVALDYFDIKRFFSKNKTPVPENSETIRRALFTYVLVGLGAGVVAGLFGKGGGLIIVPVLIKLYRYSPKAAAATSLAALQLPVGLPSVVVYAQNGHFNFLYAALIAVGMVAGTFLGTKIGIKLPGSYFKKIYAFFLLAVAVYMVVKYL